MGIKDLLRFIKPYIEPIHIKKYAGQRVGIDAYSWLHKGAYSCSMELTLNTEGEKKFQYLNYFMHRINLLRHYEVTPVVVFDGASMPSKAATQDDRERRRKLNRDLAMEKLKEGNVSAASELFQRSMSISPSMAHQLIQILRSEDVEFIVAPYEADAQLAHLSKLDTKKGGITAVISEDSDLLAYGCSSVIFKMDRHGNGEELILENIFSSNAGLPSFRNFDMELFTGMCVLAGCDFLPSVPGIGIVKAHNLVSKYHNLDRVLSVLKSEKGYQMPESYSKSFKESMAVFKHARIYDSSTKQIKHLKPIPQELLECFDEGLDFLGPEMSPSVVTGIARGNLNPTTLEAFNVVSDQCHFKPSNKIRVHVLDRKEKPSLPTKEGSFTAISSYKLGNAESKGALQQKQLTSPAEVKLVNGARELEKLMLHLEDEAEVGQKKTQKAALRHPDNNPFKKRKTEEIQTEENNTVEEVSVLTEIEAPEMVCATPESQKSVESNPVNMTHKQTRAQTLKKLKSSNSNDSSAKKNSTILNFFSRV